MDSWERNPRGFPATKLETEAPTHVADFWNNGHYNELFIIQDNELSSAWYIILDNEL
jgi:hypothetical protein